MPPEESPPAPDVPRGTVVGAIPARWASTRLPGKPLLPIAGRPMIEHVYRRAEAVPGLDRLVVLTDDDRIERAVRAFGGACEMTPGDCTSGTDRIAWAARRWDAAAVVNIQGDEPLIDPSVVDRVARHLKAAPDDPVVTVAAPADPGDDADPDTVKVVVDRRGYALYFSRSAIPYRRQEGGPPRSSTSASTATNAARSSSSPSSRRPPSRSPSRWSNCALSSTGWRSASCWPKRHRRGWTPPAT